MQNYWKQEKQKVEAKYNQQAYTLRSQKDNDCSLLSAERHRQWKAIDKVRKPSLFFAVALGFFIGVRISFLAIVILCVIAFFAVSAYFQDRETKISAEAQKKIDAREAQLTQAIAQLEARKQAEILALKQDINQRSKEYRRTYRQSPISNYLVKWLLNALSIEINKADRSDWLPQVKARLRFNVSYGIIEVPGFGTYDLASQGIRIDYNQVAIDALARVLERMTVERAREQFPVDANGGRTSFSSTRIDTHVEILYSAPNGRASAAR